MRVLAIAVATREDLAPLQERLGDGVTLVADPGGDAVASFGMLDPDPVGPVGKAARAGTFHIDRRGRVRRRWLPESYRVRVDPDRILEVLGA